MKQLLTIILSSFVFLTTVSNVQASMPVIDVAAIAKLIQQIQQFEEMINTLQTQYKMLKKYAKLDHEGLAGGKFGIYFSDFSTQFDQILDEIHGYQNMFDQISRLDEVYIPYHDGWENYDGDNVITHALKKQLLWSKIQMKHAAKVGATIRKTFPKSQERIETLLNDTKEAEGLLLNAQIGNQLMGEVGSNLQTLNVQMNEYLQAYTARSLEDNSSRGLYAKRLDKVLEDWGTYGGDSPAPKNPIKVLH